MIKIFAGLLIATPIIYWGFDKSVYIKKKAVFLRDMTEFASFCKERIRYLCEHRDILIKYGADKYANLPITAFLCETNSFNESLCFGYYREFSEFITSIGTSDVEGQISLCERYISFFGKEYAAFDSDLKKQIKMYTVLSVFLSAAVVIFVI